MHKKILKSFERELQKLKNPNRTDMFFAEDYIGGGTSKLIYWNIKVPHVRAQLDGAHSVYSYPQDIQFEIFERIWFTSKVFEIKSIALHWLEGLKNDELIRRASRIAKWSRGIDNWAHSDAFCGVLARIFESSPRSLKATLKKWNRDKNPWLRRCSMVSLFYYARSRKKVPSFSFASSLVVPHLGAPEYYVQKGVGWTIREMYNCYPKETIAFIEKNLYKIKAAAWYAATEKLPRPLKNKLVLKRRAHRKLM